MESYIDFIKKYNSNENSSSQDSNFNDYLKGGANKINMKIKGGFPPVFEVNSTNDSFREFYPNLKVKNILEINNKSPFINVNSKEGGFLENFIKFNKKNNLNSNNLQNELDNNLYHDISVDKKNNNLDTSIDLPKNIEIISIDKMSNSKNQLAGNIIGNFKDNNLLKKNSNKIENDNLDTTLDLPENLEIISIDSFKNQNGGKQILDTLDDTTIDLPENLEVISVDSFKDLNGGGEQLLDTIDDTTIDLPDDLEVVSIESYKKQNGGEKQLVDTVDDTTIDLPDNLEIITIDSIKNQNGGEQLVDTLDDTTIDLPENLEFVSIESFKDQNGGLLNDEVESIDSTVDLPDNLEIVSIESLNHKHDGGNFSESSNDVFDSSVYLPKDLEVITINRDEILDSVDTDSSILDLLDIKSNKTESIGNLFMKNFK